MRKKFIDFYKELTILIDWKWVYITMVVLGLCGFLYSLFLGCNFYSIVRWTLLSPLCVLLGLHLGCIKSYLQKRLTKNEVKAEVVKLPKKIYIIKNIRRGWNNSYQSNFLYAEVYMVDNGLEGLVACDTVDGILMNWFNRMHLVENYKEVFLMLMKHNKEVFRGK